MEVLLVIANLSITAAYWVIATALTPGFRVPMWSRVGAIDGRTVIKDASPAALKRMPKAPRELMHREVVSR